MLVIFVLVFYGGVGHLFDPFVNRLDLVILR